jgi:hypothetical protein
MSQLQACLPWLGLLWLRFVAAMVMLLEEQLLGQQRVRRLGAWYKSISSINVGERDVIVMIGVYWYSRVLLSSFIIL